MKFFIFILLALTVLMWLRYYSIRLTRKDHKKTHRKNIK